jgi:perosamine synthetase
MISIYKPYLPPGSLSKAHDALDSSWLSSQGKYLPIVQEKLQELLGVKYVLLLNNGTSSCHLVAKALRRVCPPTSNKKKIIVPNNVYVAAWNAFLFDKDYELIPIDADLKTWNIDLYQLNKMIGQYPDADVLVVHNIGNIVNVPELRRKYPHTHFVEDNCEGFLGKYEGQATGTAAIASAISFFGNKNITSGEGGAFITNSEELYQYAKCIQGQGQSETRFVHKELGYNYRMTNIQAAILCGQLQVLPDIINMKREIFETYRRAFGNREDILIQEISNNTENANWMFGVQVPGQLMYEAAELYFKMHGIEIRPMFYSIHTHKHLKNNADIIVPSNNINADILNKKSFILPSYPELTKEEQKYIIDTVNGYVIGVNGP